MRQFSVTDFEPLLGQTFALAEPGHVEALTLVSAIAGRHTAPGFPPPFTLSFEGESASVMLGQSIYRLHNSTLGRVDLFLACTGRLPSGRFRYEAVFS